MTNNIKNDTQNFYNETDMGGGIYKEKVEYFASFVNEMSLSIKDINVIDVGCYDGRFGDYVYSKFGLKIDGADISNENLRKAKYLRDSFVIDLDTTEKWNLDKKYHVVIAGDIIEHLIHTDEFVQNINSLQNVGDYLLISTPNIASLARRLMLLCGLNPYIEISKFQDINGSGLTSVGHIRYFTPDNFKAILNAYGYELVKVYNTGVNLPMGINSKWMGTLCPSLMWHLIYLCKKVK